MVNMHDAASAGKQKVAGASVWRLLKGPKAFLKRSYNVQGFEARFLLHSAGLGSCCSLGMKCAEACRLSPQSHVPTSAGRPAPPPWTHI